MKDYLLFLKKIILYIGESECDYATKIIKKYKSQSDITPLHPFCSKYFKEKLFKIEEQIKEKTYSFKKKKMAKVYIKQITGDLSSMTEIIRGWANLIGVFYCTNMPYDSENYATVLNSLYDELSWLNSNLERFKNYFFNKKEIKHYKLKESPYYIVYADNIGEIVKKNIDKNSSLNEIKAEINSYLENNTIQIIEGFFKYYKEEIENRKYYFKKELKQRFNENNFIKEIFTDLKNIEKDKFKVINNTTTAKQKKIITKALEYYVDKLAQYYKYAIENMSNFRIANTSVDMILNNKQNIQSEFVWNREKNDLIELIQALYLTNSIKKINNETFTKKEFVEFVGKVFNFPIKSFDSTLNTVVNRITGNNKFLKELNTKYLDKIEEDEEKRRARK